MTTVVDDGLHHSALSHLPQTHIDELSPLAELTGNSYIEGSVALIWPYSSSTGTLSLLLVDRDIRLRRSKGQVKIVFSDECAREVAKSKLGINDKVKLGLNGAEWVNSGDTVATPGKKISWDLRYRKRALLDILRDGRLLAFVDVDQADETTAPSELLQTTPQPNGISHRQIETTTIRISAPAFSQVKGHLTGSFLDASLDPFAEDDGFVLGKGRKRTKFARNSGSWKLTEDTSEEVPPTGDSVPGGELMDVNQFEATTELTVEALPAVTSSQGVQLELGHLAEISVDDPAIAEVPQTQWQVSEPVGTAAEIVADESGPPIEASSDSPLQGPDTMVLALSTTPPGRSMVPGVDTPDDNWDYVGVTKDSQAAIMPHLSPHSSPGLPLVSPLIQRNGPSMAYFPEYASMMSELDGSSPFTQAIQHHSAPEDLPDMPAAAFTMSTATFNGIDHDINTSENHESPVMDRYPAALEHDIQEASNSYAGTSTEAEEIESEVSATSEGEFNASAPISAPELNIGMTENHKVELVQASSARPMEDLVEDEDMQEQLTTSGRVDQPPSESHSPHQTPINPLAVIEINSTIESTNLEPTSNATDMSNAPGKWEDKLAIAAVECTTDEILTPPPFPFQQGWDKSFKRRRSSGYQPSYDGASDDIEVISGNGVPERSQAQLLTATCELSEASLQVDLQQTTSLIHELDSAGMKPRVNGSEADAAADSLEKTPDDQVSTQNESSEQLSPTEMLVRPPELSIHSVIYGRLDTRLPSLDDTQPTVAPEVEPGRADKPQPSFPPSPQTTREELDPDLQLPRTTRPDPNLSFESDLEGADKLLLPTQETKPRTSRRLSRKSLPLEVISEISSPYFTPRRSARMASSQQPSSPFRKENVPIASSDRPSSPVGRIKDLEGTWVAGVNGVTKRLEELPALAARTSSFTTSLSHYASLSSISDHYNQIVDIIAVCTLPTPEAQRAKSGPRDFHCTLTITDTSLSGTDAVITQIFRPYKTALPAAQRGSVVILRSFKVQSQKRKCILVSTEASAWAVFSRPTYSVNARVNLDIQKAGPPIEHGAQEHEQVFKLMRWWDAEGQGRYPVRVVPSRNMKDIGQGPPAHTRHSMSPGKEIATQSRLSRRRGNYTDNIGDDMEDPIRLPAELSPPPPTSPARHRRKSAGSMLSGPPKSPTEPPARISRRSMRSESVVHELRDGIRYTDDDDRTSLNSRRSRRGESLVHELRDGVTYIDE